MDYLRVKNWKNWQHYKDREPPWVKLHAKLLRDDDFVALTEEQQWQLVRIWMVASQSSRYTLDEQQRIVPVVANNETAIRRATASLKKVALPLFIEQGWLIEVPVEKLVENTTAASTDDEANASAGDSTTLDKSLHDDSQDASALLVVEVQRVRELPETTNPEPNRTVVLGEPGNGTARLGDESDSDFGTKPAGSNFYGDDLPTIINPAAELQRLRAATGGAA